MSTGSRWKTIGMALLLSSGLFCAEMPIARAAVSGQTQRRTPKKKKQAELPQLPSGPTGQPLRPMPLDAIAAVPPQVTFENNQLTINAPNSTLADVLRAVRKSTGAEIDVPAAPERVVTHLGPGPAREVIADLLNGSRFNYVLLGSPTDVNALTRVVLVAKSGVQEIPANPAAPQNPNFAAQQTMPQEADTSTDTTEAEPAEDNTAAPDENAEQAQPDADQSQTPQEQPPGVKTPQQMLQEMQQRQMQMQQQGQPPVPGQGPGSGMQPHPPEQN